jgi:cell division protein FtsN
VIRKHEADGRTVYRVRVGPMSKDEANGLCSRLKTAGGACFVAGG